MYSAASTSLAARPPGPPAGAPVSTGPPTPLVTWQLGEERRGSKVTGRGSSRSADGSDPCGKGTQKQTVCAVWVERIQSYQTFMWYFINPRRFIFLQRGQSAGLATEEPADVPVQQQGGCLLTQRDWSWIRVSLDPAVPHWSLIAIPIWAYIVVAPTFALQFHLMHGLTVLVLVQSRSAVLFPRPVRLSWLLLSITFTCTAMGCIQSIACNKSRIKRENIVVYDLSATIDHCPTLIEENSPIVLRYKTPYFKASARIVMPPVPRNETWVVGWIQACTQMEFYNTYGDIGMWVHTSFTCVPITPLWRALRYKAVRA